MLLSCLLDLLSRVLAFFLYRSIVQYKDHWLLQLNFKHGTAVGATSIGDGEVVNHWFIFNYFPKWSYYTMWFCLSLLRFYFSVKPKTYICLWCCDILQNRSSLQRREKDGEHTLGENNKIHNKLSYSASTVARAT